MKFQKLSQYVKYEDKCEIWKNKYDMWTNLWDLDGLIQICEICERNTMIILGSAKEKYKQNSSSLKWDFNFNE